MSFRFIDKKLPPGPGTWFSNDPPFRYSARLFFRYSFGDI